MRRLVLVLVFILVLEYLVLPQLVDASASLEVLGRASPVLVGAAVVLELLAWLVYSGLTLLLLPPDDRPGYFTVLRIDLCDFGANHVLPGGGTTAAAIRYRLLTLAGTWPENALSAATVEIIGSNLVLGGIFAVGLLLALPVLETNVYYLLAAVVVFVILAGAITAVITLRRHLRGAVRVARGFARAVRFIHEDRAEDFVRRMARQMEVFRTDRRALVLAVMLAALNWLFDAAALWIFVAAFGHTLGAGELLVAFGLASILMMLPLTPGGLGIVEGLLIPTLVGFGVPHPTAVLGVIGWRLVQFWLPIPLGSAAYVSLRLGVLRRHNLPKGLVRSATDEPPES